jgi:nucleoredoxin
MYFRICLALLAFASPALGAGLPMETTVTTATKIEIMRDGNLSGSIGLPIGAKLDVITLDGEYVQVRYRSLSGRVKAAHTELAALAAAMNRVPAAPAVTALPLPTTAAAPVGNAAVPSAMARRLQGKLVQLQGNALKPQDPTRLNHVHFYALYYSAAWCGPCRQFTPQLVRAYQELRAEHPEFEVVFISADRSAGDMQKYMTGDKMAWPALRFDQVRQSGEIMRYSGDGIPCLVLVDAAGRVLSDSYRGGNYVGPQAVLKETRRILQQHREKNPRPST